MRSETHKMESSVGPLLLLSLVAFVSVTLARSVFTFTDVLAAATADFNLVKARRQKLLDLQRRALCGQCRC
uniref:Uncharacterized protein n=1 Tax=Anguilla anguilla TaxID=7936 RepID=A0A0E9RD53_ANGAN